MFFSSSSRSAQRINPDGSWNVFCWQCNEYIGRTFVRMQRAVCEMCRRTEAGEVLTEQAIKDYKLSKLAKVDVSMLLLPQEEKPTKFSFRSLTGEVLSAIGIKKKEKPVDATKSKAVSKSKYRGPLFQNVDLGSMDQIDQKLKEKP